MLSKKQFLLVGKIVGVHGIKGEVKIFPYGSCDKKPWKKLYLSMDEQNEVCEVVGNRPNKGVIIAILKGYTDRNSAGKLVGYNVFVDTAEIPQLPKDEYYNFQLEGMEVVTDAGRTVGVITSIISTGSNDVYVVKAGGTPRASKGEEILIPAISDVVLKVDIVKKKMIVRMPEGLLSEPAEGRDE